MPTACMSVREAFLVQQRQQRVAAGIEPSIFRAIYIYGLEVEPRMPLLVFSPLFQTHSGWKGRGSRSSSNASESANRDSRSLEAGQQQHILSAASILRSVARSRPSCAARRSAEDSGSKPNDPNPGRTAGGGGTLWLDSLPQTDPGPRART